MEMIIYAILLLVAIKLYYRFEISRATKHFKEDFLLLPADRRKLLLKIPEFLDMDYHSKKADQSNAFYEKDWHMEQIFSIQDRIKAIEQKSENQLFTMFKMIMSDHFHDSGYYDGKAEIIFLFKLVPIYERFFELAKQSKEA